MEHEHETPELDQEFDPVFEEEQQHLTETYAKLQTMGRDLLAKMEANSKDAAADKLAMVDELSVNLASYADAMETYADFATVNRVIDAYNLAQKMCIRDRLLHDRGALSAQQKEHLYRDIHDDACWLVTLVENLLSITRIDNGTLQLAEQPELVADVVREALQHVDRRAGRRRVDVELEDELLMADMDARLILSLIHI